MPTYPNVPNAPGVPPVPRDPTAPIIDNVVIAVSDAVIVARLFQTPQWGLFDSTGANALNVSSTLTMEMRGDAAVTTAPLEGGAFVSYNKVITPRLLRMSFAISNGTFLPPGIGGLLGAPDINSFLASLELLRDTPILLTAVTPNAVYEPVTVVHYEYRRTAQSNATMLTADVWVEEIRQPGAAKFSRSNTTSPSSSDPVNLGTVQPIQVDPNATNFPDITKGATAPGGGGVS